jgi:indole-3-glycerol phosphate synthase
MNILDKIVANTIKEVDARKAQVSVAQLEQTDGFLRATFAAKDFFPPVNEERSGIIAEFKRMSPSKGLINPRTDVETVTKGYADAGASMLSILAEEKYFGGSMEYIKRARLVNKVPILRKDFIVDEYQVIEAKSIGADAILLIAACLSRQEMIDLGKLAHSLNLSVLMEVHNEEELGKCINPYIDLLGVNNRNLKTFDVSIETSISLVNKIPNEFIKVSESGLSEAQTIIDLKDHGFTGFLIGETFMKTNDPALELKKLVTQLKNTDK